MNPDLEPTPSELFDGGSDFDLCHHLFVRICERHGNDVKLSALSEAERVVNLVWYTYGVIGNGGFRYLFEHQWDDDPDFTHAARAYEVIGCREADGAFRNSLELFPNGKPPANLIKHLQRYASRVTGGPTPDDYRFLNAKADIERCLADFARRSRAAFGHLGE